MAAADDNGRIWMDVDVVQSQLQSSVGVLNGIKYSVRRADGYSVIHSRRGYGDVVRCTIDTCDDARLTLDVDRHATDTLGIQTKDTPKEERLHLVRLRCITGYKCLVPPRVPPLYASPRAVTRLQYYYWGRVF